jgi:glutamate-1-semialdehyde 2,1-aminomutase
VVGREDIMRLCEPPDNIFYSGTMFGETLSLAAAIATIDKLESTKALSSINKNGHYIRTIINDLIIRHKLQKYIALHGHVSLNRINFSGDSTNGYPIYGDEIKTLFIQEMIRKGVLIIASHNLSYAHGMPEIARVIGAWTHALGVIRQAVDAKNTAAFIEGQSIQKFAAVR